MADPRSPAARLAAEGLSASEWSNAAGDRYAEHRHSYDKIIVALAGSITFHLTEIGREIELRKGDRLELPAEILHGATVGPHGVRCLEAHLPANSLDDEPLHRVAGW